MWQTNLLSNFTEMKKTEADWNLGPRMDQVLTCGDDKPVYVIKTINSLCLDVRRTNKQYYTQIILKRK